MRAVALKAVTANEPQFTGHFPGRPIMPGVLMVEALAQTAGIAVVTLRRVPRQARVVRRDRRVPLQADGRPGRHAAPGGHGREAARHLRAAARRSPASRARSRSRRRSRSSSRATSRWAEGRPMRDGERRVVVTGMGALTPIGNDVPAFWDALVNGRSGITPHHPLRPGERRRQGGGRGEGLRRRCGHAEEGGPTQRPLRPLRLGGDRRGDARRRPQNADRGRGAGLANGRDHRLGHRRHQHHDPRRHRGARLRHRPHRSVPGHRDDPGHGGGLRRDLRQRARAELRDGQRLLEQRTTPSATR